jgi:hypothetical protein
MNKTELIDKLLHLGNTTEMCCSTDRHNAKELAHTLLDEYLEAINDTQCCESDSEPLVCGCGKNKPVRREPAYLHCDWCGSITVETK